MKIITSGIQPTGNIHIGNYFGAIKNWVNLQKIDAKRYFFLANLHALTVYQDPKELEESTLNMAITLLACGIDENKSNLFIQSSVKEHTELAWIFNCIARVGWLNRMTQFKDKAGKNKEKSSVGLYTYPVLQAADILLYNTTHVPVGQDQKQHIELTRDIVEKFKEEYKTDIFTTPEPLIVEESKKIMSLKNGTEKMSKSNPSELSRIEITDSNDDIVKKIKKAKTDAELIPCKVEDLEERKEALNLLTIYSLCTNQTLESTLNEMQGKGFKDLKPKLTDALINIIEPINIKCNDYAKNKDYVKSILNNCALNAQERASNQLERVRKTIGVYF